MLFIVCMGLFFLSVWWSKSRISLRQWHKVDFSLLIVLAVCVVFLCAKYLFSHPSYSLMPLCSAIVYAVVIAAAGETLARIRDKTLASTLYWPRFFKVYTLRKPIGLLMAVVLTGVLLYLLILCPIGTVVARFNPRVLGSTPYYFDNPYASAPFGFNIIIYLFSALVLAALTYFCAFVLSLSAEYDKANAEAIRAERFKSELITNVSHDIRTPLTSIINYVDLIKRLPSNDAVLTEYIGVLDKKSQRLKVLIGDLLDASKAGTGNVHVDLQTIDLTEIIGQIAGEFDGAFTDTRLIFVFTPEKEKVPVIADGSLLWRVVENIFSNATKYAMPDTRVYAGITQDNGAVTFTLKNVSKEPLNISPEELTERFVRGDRSRSDEGNGLGLYIAQNLVELMGGQFAIHISGDLFEAVIQLKQVK